MWPRLPTTTSQPASTSIEQRQQQRRLVGEVGVGERDRAARAPRACPRRTAAPLPWFAVEPQHDVGARRPPRRRTCRRATRRPRPRSPTRRHRPAGSSSSRSRRTVVCDERLGFVRRDHHAEPHVAGRRAAGPAVGCTCAARTWRNSRLRYPMTRTTPATASAAALDSSRAHAPSRGRTAAQAAHGAPTSTRPATGGDERIGERFVDPAQVRVAGEGERAVGEERDDRAARDGDRVGEQDRQRRGRGAAPRAPRRRRR